MRLFKKSQSAWSLLELFSAVAVIAVLGALVFPAAGRVKERAQMAASLGNLKAIGAAFHSYAAENGGKFPYCWDSDSGLTYAHEVMPYLAGELQNPSRSPFVNPAARKRITASATTIAITYSAHPVICHEKEDDDKRIPLSRISRPSEIILLADGSQCPWNNNQSTASFWNPWQIFFPDLAPPLSTPIPVGPDVDEDWGQGWIRYRNRGAAHALCVDGSVKSFRKGEILFQNVIVGH